MLARQGTMYGRVARTRCARNFAPLRARLFATDYSKYGLSPGMQLDEGQWEPVLPTTAETLQGLQHRRKPEKQAAWRVESVPQGNFWNLRDSMSCVTFGEGVQVQGDCVELRPDVRRGGQIVFGDGVSIGDRSIIHAGAGVSVGRNSVLGTGALIMDRNHHGIGNDAEEVISAIEIGDDVTLGEYVTILPGTKIAAGSSIPACSIVIPSRTGHKVVARSDELLTEADELLIRHCLAYNTVTPLGVPAPTELGTFNLTGDASDVHLSASAVTFYQRPWEPLNMLVGNGHTVSVDGESFMHHSGLVQATGGSVRVGKYCQVSWRAALLTQLDSDTFPGLTGGASMKGDVELGDSVWIGAGVVLLPGTSIGAGSLVGAGSVVQGHFPPHSIIVGNPGVPKKALEPFVGLHGQPL